MPSNRELTLIIEAQNRTERSLTDIQRQNARASQRISRSWEQSNERSMQSFKRFAGFVKTAIIGGVLVGMTRAVMGVGKQFIDAAVKMEQLRNGLKAVEGDAKVAAAELAKLQEIAKLPGISLSQAVEAQINLRAVKLNADLARRAITEVGNALAIVGKSDELTGVILGMTQMVAQGKVLQEEINQIASRIPQFRQAMIDAFGTARSEDIQKMGISVETFLTKTTDQLGKLQRATEGGATAISNYENAMVQFKATVGDIILPAFTSILNKMTSALNAVSEAIKNARAENERQEEIRAEQRARARAIAESTPGVSPRVMGGGMRVSDFLRLERPLPNFQKRPLGRSLESRRITPLDGRSIPATFPSQESALQWQDEFLKGLRGDYPVPSKRPFLKSSHEARIPMPASRRQQFLPQLLPPSPSVQFRPDIAAQMNQGITRAFQPTVQFRPDIAARINQRQQRFSTMAIPPPDLMPHGATGLEPIKRLEDAQKTMGATALDVSNQITTAFNQIANATDNMTLRVTAQVITMVQNILNSIAQTQAGGLGGLLTTVGVTAGAATGIGIGVAAVAGGVAIMSTIQAQRSQRQALRQQPRTLRTN